MFFSSKFTAKRNAWTMGVSGAIVQTGALAWWIFDSHRFVQKMQELTVWPYPALYGWGLWTHVGGLGATYLSIIFGLVSWLIVGDGSSSSQAYSYGGEYAAYGEAAYPAGGQAF